MLALGALGPGQAGRVSRCPEHVTVVSEVRFGFEMVESSDDLAGTQDGVRLVSLLSSKLIILFDMNDRYDYLKREITLYSGHHDLMFGSMTVYTKSCPYLYIEDFTR